MKKNAGLTNREIAELSGIPEATVTKVINGDTCSPNLITVSSIVKALGGSMDEILGIPPCEENSGDAEEKAVDVEAYRMLLESKQQEIERMQENHNQELLRMKKDCNVFLILFICLLVVLVFIVVFDLINGNIGYIRYQTASRAFMLVDRIKTLMTRLPLFMRA